MSRKYYLTTLSDSIYLGTACVNVKLWKGGPFVLHKIFLNNVHHFHCLVVSWLHVIVRNLCNFYNLENYITHLNTLSVMHGVPEPVSPVTQILTYELWLFTSTSQIIFEYVFISECILLRLVASKKVSFIFVWLKFKLSWWPV